MTDPIVFAVSSLLVGPLQFGLEFIFVSLMHRQVELESHGMHSNDNQWSNGTPNAINRYDLTIDFHHSSLSHSNVTPNTLFDPKNSSNN